MTDLVDPALYLVAPDSDAHANAHPMLLSPNPSPEPGRPVSEDPPRRSAPAACLGRLDPVLGQHPSHELDPDPLYDDVEGETTREERIRDTVDRVPLHLARVVLSMQEHYASELEAERQKTDQLLLQNEMMKRKMDEMEKRIEMHVVIMDGFVGFMRDVKEGRFAVGARAIPTELEIAKHLRLEHSGEVEAIASMSRPQPRVVRPSVKRRRLDEQAPSYYEEEVDELPLNDTAAQISPQWANTVGDTFDQLPPTPDMDTAPVRSTGRRAPKRRNPPLRTRRQVQRRSRASQESSRTTDARSWTPINAIESDLDAGQSSTPDLHLDPIPEQEGDDGDFDYEPALEDSADEHSTLPASRPSSPSPSIGSPLPAEGYTPRYSVPRSVAYRYATGPPGRRRFKHHRMPKTVALVWAEWKHGLHGNQPIEELEGQYGTTWRLGTLQERKYASNYVGVRQKIVRKVEEMCEEEGISVEDACKRLDDRVDGRMQLLMTALRKGEDPLEVIPRRRRRNENG